MRKQFFRGIDSLLPRWLAKAPYLFALLLIRLLLSRPLGLKVWNRNSTKTNSFVFGVSDLDLTVLGSSLASAGFLTKAFLSLKRVFPFLGEVNYYVEEELSFVLKRMNPFELRRDPLLGSCISESKTPSKAQKFVFLVRMLFSDVHSLGKTPVIRQAKWRHHLRETGNFREGEFITVEVVVRVLKEIASETPRICRSLDLWANQVFTKDFNPYRAPLGEGFWILAPHLHLWFEEGDEKTFLRTLSEFEKEVLRSQIDWEFWGLYTQRLYSEQNVLPHLERLLEVLHLIAPDEVQSLEREISLVFKHR